ncbi:hypothetical protein XELAEV_18042666mg [Xenopus laevis]|uniref:Fibrinogen C-terminal domain-containing protein n=1 Tax=Xenopus laevis TaxID=8355 RepID=A0A974C4N7_XENLA|nr:hypothetical protein XELAEV_18042666mg [Xenopus laevis]
MRWIWSKVVAYMYLLGCVLGSYSCESVFWANNHLLPGNTDSIMNGKETVFSRDCSEILYKSQGIATDGLYVIQPADVPIVVICIMQDKGWTVIQHITANSSLDFDRGWEDYKFGFGSVLGDHWLGNEYMHQLTQPPGLQKLGIRLVTMEGEIKLGVYDPVLIESEDSQYRLRLGLFHGSATDALTRDTEAYVHDNQKFTTRDRDNDNYIHNCAKLEHEGIAGGGWWYDACAGANLNRRNIIYWQKDCTKDKLCKYATMMLQSNWNKGYGKRENCHKDEL